MIDEAKKDPKDVKTSIRNKYNRRLLSLSLVLVDFLTHARERLDEGRAGKIHKRANVEAIVAKCEELNALLPHRQDEPFATFISGEELERVLEEAGRQTEAMIKEGQEFFNNLSEDEWRELREYANDQ